jgi:predicted ABC-type ATPase
MKFKDFLREQKEKHAVLAFGRMNPITNGHEKLVNKVKDIATKVGGSHHIVLSHSQDPKKNPLSAAQKVKHASHAFAGTNFTAASKKAPTFFDHAEKLHKQGVSHLHMVGGSDRVDEYDRLLNKYNGTHSGARFNFKSIQVHSAGERDPDAEGVSGISASKMRDAAKNGDFDTFKKGAPSTMSQSNIKQMYNDVRKGMNLREAVELGENDLSRFSKYVIKPVKTEPKIVRKTNPAGRTSDHVEYEVHGTLSSQKRTFKSKKEAEAYYNTVKEETLLEGVHDKGIFKAVFLGGGPGSGKDYVLSNTLDGHGLTEINSDKALEYLMDKEDLDMKMPESEEEQRNAVRKRAKNVTELRQRLALHGRNGIIINGTGDDPEKYKKIKEKLEALGYETKMVMVNTEDEVSRQRNVERGQRGGRTVPEDIRKEKWDAVQASRVEHAKTFGDSYSEFDNSEDLRSAPPEVVDAKTKEMQGIFKDIQKFVAAAPKNDQSKQWIANELGKKDTAPVVKDARPHADAGHQDEGNKLGLEYYGFGRYGKDGKVTHRSVHGKLVEIEKKQKETPDLPVMGSGSSSTKEFKLKDKQKERLKDISAKSKLSKLKKENVNEDLRNWFDDKHPEGGWKRINSKGEAIGPCAREPGEAKPKCMSNEKRASLTKKERASAVSAKRRHDPNPERKGEPINVSNVGKGKISEAAYEGNIGMMEVMKFHQKATDDQKKKFKEHLANKNHKEAWKMIQHVSGTKLVGKQFEEVQTKHTLASISELPKDKKTTITFADGNKKKYDSVQRMGKGLRVYHKDGKNNYDGKPSDSIKLHQLQGAKFQFHEETQTKKQKLLSDRHGKPRTFLLRASAAKEAHVKGGTVHKAGSKYVIKIKEDKDEVYSPTNNAIEAIYGQNSSTPSAKQLGKVGISSREKDKPRLDKPVAEERRTISLSTIKENFQKKIEESIDKGIEPGISMAAAGESPARDMGEKLSKRGKATQVVPKNISELTGDETTASIGDQKEDELKKKGISLLTFKKRNFI